MCVWWRGYLHGSLIITHLSWTHSLSQTWLGRFLSNYQGTIVTVSHDEALLEGVKLSTVAEVANNRVEVFKGCGFKKFLFERDERMR